MSTTHVTSSTMRHAPLVAAQDRKLEVIVIAECIAHEQSGLPLPS